jgi:hypothetical protein
MSKEMMSTLVETDGDGFADLIADLLEYLLDPDDDVLPLSDERPANEASGGDLVVY